MAWASETEIGDASWMKIGYRNMLINSAHICFFKFDASRCKKKGQSIALCCAKWVLKELMAFQF